MTLLTALAFAAPSMQSFEDCDDYDQALTEAIVEQLLTYDVGWYGYRGLETLGYAEPSARAGAEDSGSAGPATYSGTNVQEQGVDELDWVKTDGRFIYMLNGDELAIVKSWPVDEAEKVGRLPLDGQLRSLFVQGDRALVLSYVATDRGQSGTRATLVDLRDRTRPRVLRTLDMDGWMTSGRLIGDHAYLVMNANTAVPQEVWNLLYSGDIALEPYPWDASPGAQRMALEKRRRQLTPHVARILQKQGRDERLMRYSDSQSGWMPRSGTLLSCSDILSAAGLLGAECEEVWSLNERLLGRPARLPEIVSRLRSPFWRERMRSLDALGLPFRARQLTPPRCCWSSSPRRSACWRPSPLTRTARRRSSWRPWAYCSAAWPPPRR